FPDPASRHPWAVLRHRLDARHDGSDRHPQRHPDGHHPHDRGGAGDPPAGRRLDPGAGGAAALARRARGAHPGDVVTASWQPRLVALDIDGTLLRWVEGSGAVHGEVDPVVRDAVRRAAEAGAEIVLASGRSLHSMLPIAEQLGLPLNGERCWIVASHGAVVVQYPPVEI